MDDNDNGDDADPADMMGKYDGKGNKKEKGGRCRYRGNNKIKALHGLCEKPNDGDGECGDHDDDWDVMKEMEQENEDVDDNIINITAAQLFGTPDKVFHIKNNNYTE